MKAEELIGSWGFIIGDSRISPEMWSKAFPQNIFGRVIGVNKNGLLMLRGYRPRKGYFSKHPHFKTSRKYFQSELPLNL